MRIVILPSKQQAIEFCSEFYCQFLKQKPNSVLGLATGGTPVDLYKSLIEQYQAGNISFSQVTSFNLDEYWQLAPEHPQSYRYFMQQNLFDHIDIHNTHLPDALADNAKRACDDYEQKIVAAGGIDLQLLGIGSNGHIGFNEPTSSLCSRTRLKTLATKTLEDNARFFGKDEYQPHTAITMGIGTILEAKEILLLATGESKADAVKATIEGPLSAFVPASALQQHNNTTVVLDADAAAKLSLKDYYLAVEKERQNVDPGARGIS